MRLLLFIVLLSVTSMSGQSVAQDDYKEVNPNDLLEILQPSTGQKRVLLVYASWCPHCQTIFPKLIDIEKDYPGSVQAISMDKDIDKFKEFTKQFPNLTIDPLIWNKEFHLGISLGELGVNFPGFIPFIALIDQDRKTVKQGYLTVDEIKNFLQ